MASFGKAVDFGFDYQDLMLKPAAKAKQPAIPVGHAARQQAVRVVVGIHPWQDSSPPPASSCCARPATALQHQDPGTVPVHSRSRQPSIAMNTHPVTLSLLLALPLGAQTDAFLPSDHASAEGSTFDRRLPFSSGATQHTQIIYEGLDLQIPTGHSITHLGFRQDASIPSLGTTLELQIAIAATSVTAASATNNFANNQTSAPVEVFTRKILTLPDLGNPLNPNPNGNLVLIPLDVPFAYTAGQNLAIDYRVYSNGRGAAFDYQIDKGSYLASNVAIGQGCTGSNNQVPQLTGPAANGAVPGTWTVNFSRGRPNAIAVLALSLRQTPANPILQLLGAPGCDVFVDLHISPFTSVTSASGAFSRSFQIPDNPLLDDQDLYAQTIVLDTTANAAGLVVSNAYHTQFGMTPRMTTIASTNLNATTGSVVRNNGIVSLFRHQ